MKIDKPHCSKLDRIFACPGSILPSDAPKEAGGPDAIMGRAKHEALACIPLGADPPTDEIAAKYAVDRDEIELAVRLGRKAWAEVGPYFPRPRVERPVGSSVCVGTSDVVQIIHAPVSESCLDYDRSAPPLALRVADWKTGWARGTHPYQLRGYALGLVEEFGWPSNGVVSCFEIHTSHQQTITTNLGRADLKQFSSELAQIIEIAEKDPSKLEYRAGNHCNFCLHFASCEVRESWARGAVTSLIAVDRGALITREMIGEAYGKFQAAERACAQFKRLVEAALEDGPIPLPDGRQIAYIESEREKIAMGPAIRALVRSGRVDCGEDEDTLKGDLSKKALDAWAKGNAPKGGKAALMRKVMAELRDADAIRTVPHRQRGVVEGA